ncbi:slipin family protein [Ulvibacter litoralis]|uniref:SPFH domain / Band 7 family protein n=1 Tax=Ulvibacter litoralis TaxID=227084 RepID=A0A1G7DIT4_9FLAO|nr:slipin family protein [Ulvibacter litoralis]GHC43265.1 peptidase [Ulvibacter litoralis]SDE51444.1 SPFH domain / Band 7 family protein [Ulvibacter litoralis]
MKRVRINAGKVGLVFKKGDYVRVLTKGVHWMGWNCNVKVYDLSQPINVMPIAIEVLLEDEKLKAMLHVVEVKDNELVVVTKNDRYNQVLTTGRYVFWKGFVTYEFTVVDLDKIYITEKINKALFSNYELNKHIRVFEVAAYEKAVLLVDDVFVKTLGGGTYRFWKNDTTIKIAKVDMRQLRLEVAGQELLTKDKAAIRINFDTLYKVVNIEKAVLENKDFEKQLYVALQLALRTYVGTYTLDELLENKTEIAKAVFEDTKTAATKLGVSIIDCGIRDVILTGEMKDIMNQVLVAQKKAQANVISRREETASTRSLLNTAKLMEENEMLYKLKEMEFVETIASKIGEITVSGNGGMVTQLKDIFAVRS